MQISIKSNIDQVKKTLSKVEKKQIPYASSRALNSLAFSVRKGTVTGIEKTYNNKSKWYKKSSPVGLEVEKSNKKHLVAKVGFKKANYFVGLQETGGTKRAKKGKLVVPISTAKIAKNIRSQEE